MQCFPDILGDDDVALDAGMAQMHDEIARAQPAILIGKLRALRLLVVRLVVHGSPYVPQRGVGRSSLSARVRNLPVAVRRTSRQCRRGRSDRVQSQSQNAK